jgi:uncharacterized protein YjbJ (UPF0337 family)
MIRFAVLEGAARYWQLKEPMMVSTRLQDRIDQASGKVKRWAGRATGNAGREREGRIQSTLAVTRIKLRDAAKKIMRAFRGRLANRRHR